METNFYEIAKLKSFNARKAALAAYIKNNETVPALYVGTYDKYNNGDLSGAWVNLLACGDVETFNKVIRVLHVDENYPEFMFQDFCNLPKELYHESGGIYDLFEYIEALKNGHDSEALAAYLQHFDIDEFSEFEDRFMGAFDSEVDFTYNLVEETELLKDAGTLALYFDYEAYARDIFINYYIFVNGFVFIKS